MRKRGGRTGPHQAINSSAASGMWDLTTHQQTKGAGSWVLPSTPPQFAPTDLTLDSKTQTTATVSFTPAPAANPPITNYKFLATPESLGPLVEGELSPADITSPITVTGLTHTTSYSLKIAAVNSLGVGPYSEFIVFSTLWNNALSQAFICGGGGSGGTYGGGGGGGTYAYLEPGNGGQFISPGITYQIVVGAGSPGTAIEVNASTGGTSSAFNQVAYGGGDGGRYNNRPAGGSTNNGGSGAYIQSKSNAGSLPSVNPSWVRQTGWQANQGWRGGAHISAGAYGSGGGAGSQWEGADAKDALPQYWWETAGGRGGTGFLYYNETAGYNYYGGGGGGSVFQGGNNYFGHPGGGGYGGGGGGGGGSWGSYGGWGGASYGGNGQSESQGGKGGNGAANSGGGGGGTSYLPGNGGTPGGNGGSGMVIIVTPIQAPVATVTGNPTISEPGQYRNYLFYSSGSIRW